MKSIAVVDQLLKTYQGLHLYRTLSNGGSDKPSTRAARKLEVIPFEAMVGLSTLSFINQVYHPSNNNSVCFFFLVKFIDLLVLPLENQN